jgi:hypothetical protein
LTVSTAMPIRLACCGWIGGGSWDDVRVSGEAREAKGREEERGRRGGKKTRKIVPGDWRRGTGRTASADLGTPFMPPVGFFFVSTTARREGRETDVRSDGVERPETARAARDRSVTRRGFSKGCDECRRFPRRTRRGRGRGTRGRDVARGIAHRASSLSRTCSSAWGGRARRARVVAVVRARRRAAQRRELW